MDESRGDARNLPQPWRYTITACPTRGERHATLEYRMHDLLAALNEGEVSPLGVDDALRGLMGGLFEWGGYTWAVCRVVRGGRLIEVILGPPPEGVQR